MNFTFDASVDEEAVVEAVGARWSLRCDDPVRRISTYLDTFDWRVYRAGGTLALRVEGPARALVWRRGADERALRVDDSSTPPAFADDLPPGPYRDALGKVIDVRRLFPIASVTSERTVWRVLDDEGKTRVRLALHHDRACAPDGELHPLPVRMELMPVRGYAKTRAKLEALLRSAFALHAVDEAPLADVVLLLPRSPVGYVHRIAHSLTAGMRADEAAKAIHRRLLRRIDNTRDGARLHTDPVFVKDLRVAVRRTRVALSEIKGVFPPEQIAEFRGEFRWLGKCTGPARDLDVYLARIPRYAAWLPVAVRPDLDALTSFLRAKQAAAQRALAAALASDRCDRLLDSWRAFLRAPVEDHPDAPQGGRPVTEVAQARIWRAYRRLHRDGAAIGPETPASALHALRLRGKKLRYLVTFFRSLFPAKRIDALLEPLETLQDVLGDFQDFEVQQETLLRFAREMSTDKAVPAETLIAMGRLVGELEARQAEARAQFDAAFVGVAAPTARAEYRRLFSSRTKASGSRSDKETKR